MKSETYSSTNILSAFEWKTKMHILIICFGVIFCKISFYVFLTLSRAQKVPNNWEYLKE